jgi:hypothetical protein
LRTACAPTSTHSNGFCVIWVCISSSSSSHEEHSPLNSGSHQAAAQHIAERQAQYRRLRGASSPDPSCAMVTSSVTSGSCQHGPVLLLVHGEPEERRQHAEL